MKSGVNLDRYKVVNLIGICTLVAVIVRLSYRATMLVGGEDAINDMFDGEWNEKINKSIKAYLK